MIIYREICTLGFVLFAQSLHLHDKYRACLCGISMLQIHSGQWVIISLFHLLCDSLVSWEGNVWNVSPWWCTSSLCSKTFHPQAGYLICSFQSVYNFQNIKYCFAWHRWCWWTYFLSQRPCLLAAASHWLKMKLLHSINWDEHQYSCVLLSLKEVKMRLIFQWVRSIYRICRHSSSQKLFWKVSHL